MNKTGFAALTALAALSIGCSAKAATYNFGVIGDDTTYTSKTINHNSGGSYTDYFTFSTIEYLDEFTTGAFTESKPFGISSADLTLYSGAVGSGKEIIASGNFDPMTQATPTIESSLSPGSYYVEANVVVPKGDRGSYTVTATTAVSAAPEPSTWALMFAGVAGIGLMMRRAKKSVGYGFKDAFAA